MARWGVTLCCAVLALGAAACTGDDDDAGAATTTSQATTTSSTTTTAPERPTSTTTTAFDPATVEGQIEAAYLRSWNVYAEAVYNLQLDEAALAGSFAERSLSTRREEIEDRITDGRASLVRLEHDYQVAIVDATTAAVVDHFVNHQVLIDPATKGPIEDDPNELLLVNFQLKLIDGAWKVTLIQKVSG